MIAAVDDLEMLVVGVLCLGTMLAGVVIAVIQQRRFKRNAQAILAAGDWGSFFSRLKETFDPMCSKAKALRGATPCYDQEYPSFYHHLYVPFRLECHERSCRGFAKIIKMFIWMGVTSFAIMGFLSLLGAAVLKMHDWYIFMLMGLGLLAFLGLGIGGFYWLMRYGRNDLELLQEIDRKLLSFGNGVEPIPYRVNVSQVLAYMDAQTF
jgi:hypothetical protein